jgi:hypothetical protein
MRTRSLSLGFWASREDKAMGTQKINVGVIEQVTIVIE